MAGVGWGRGWGTVGFKLPGKFRSWAECFQEPGAVLQSKVPGAGTESKGTGEAHKWVRGTCCVCTGSEEDVQTGHEQFCQGQGITLGEPA